MIFKTAWWGTILLLLQFAHEDEGSELLCQDSVQLGVDPRFPDSKPFFLLMINYLLLVKTILTSSKIEMAYLPTEMLNYIFLLRISLEAIV